VRQLASELEAEGMHPSEALRQASFEVVEDQVKRVALPRRFSTPMIEIFQLQSRFLQRQGKRPQRLMEHPRFRAAYDFFVLRAQAGEADVEVATWWTELQAGNPVAPPPSAPGGGGTGRRRRRRRGGRGRGRGGEGGGGEDTGQESA
jgi:poly(A) polymerase